MRIENLRSETNGNLARVAATVIWEECDRPAQEIYFETPEEFAQDLSCNPDAFLIACIIPAGRYGEERIFIEAEICPDLQVGLQIAMGWIRHWFGPDRKIVRIEAKTRSHLPNPPTSERSGFFFSGGIDSLSILRVNRLSFPLDHPGAMKDGLLIYGLEVEDQAAFKHVAASLSNLAQDAGITLIPVYTNIYSHIKDLDPDWKFWVSEYQGAALAAVAHVFSKRLTRVSIASSFDIPNVYPSGSHPLLDPCYSSYNLKIKYDDLILSRLDKTRLLSGWDVALENLRVCNRSERYGAGKLNCGKCEKCIRTRLALLVLGVLDKTSAFPEVELSEKLLMTQAYITNDSTLVYYQELIDPLATIGRDDLVRGIKRIINRYHERDFKGILKRLDRQFFKGHLLHFGKKLYSTR